MLWLVWTSSTTVTWRGSSTEHCRLVSAWHSPTAASTLCCTALLGTSSRRSSIGCLSDEFISSIAIKRALLWGKGAASEMLRPPRARKWGPSPCCRRWVMMWGDVSAAGCPCSGDIPLSSSLHFVAFHSPAVRRGICFSHTQGFIRPSFLQWALKCYTEERLSQINILMALKIPACAWLRSGECLMQYKKTKYTEGPLHNSYSSVGADYYTLSRFSKRESH